MRGDTIVTDSGRMRGPRWSRRGVIGLGAAGLGVAAATMLFNLLTDLLYQAVDPRVQLK